MFFSCRAEWLVLVVRPDFYSNSSGVMQCRKSLPWPGPCLLKISDDFYSINSL